MLATPIHKLMLLVNNPALITLVQTRHAIVSNYGELYQAKITPRYKLGEGLTFSLLMVLMFRDQRGLT